MIAITNKPEIRLPQRKVDEKHDVCEARGKIKKEKNKLVNTEMGNKQDADFIRL